MSTLKDAVKITSTMYDCQRSAKNLFGKEYKEKIQWYIDTLNEVSAREKITTIRAVIFVCNLESVNSNGMAILLFMAAVVEIMQPDTEQPKPAACECSTPLIYSALAVKCLRCGGTC